MGIQKSLSTAFGVPAVHWRIRQINIDTVNPNVHVMLEGRSVKDALSPISIKEYDIAISSLPKVAGLIKDITTYLLTTIAPAVTLDNGTVVPATPFSAFYQAAEET